jgi:hypothetical protein
MRTVFEHIDHIKTKPHHIRKKVAFGAAGAVTGLVAFVWLGTSLATGAFAIQGSNFADSTGQDTPVETITEDPNDNLAGAAAALPHDNSGPARIEIVNVATTSASKEPERTTIPF